MVSERLSEGVNESDLAEAIIEFERDKDSEITIYPEAHYQNYGFRGVADICVHFEDIDAYRIYELKSETAIEETTGANAIISQFNRMRRYFFADSFWRSPDVVLFELCFIPTEKTVEHLVEYASLYSECSNTSLCEPAITQVEVTLRSPEEPENEILFVRGGKPYSRSDFEEEARQSNPELYEQIRTYL